MTLPSSIRVNPNVPFPALVSGDAPVVIRKSNGIWRVGLSTKTIAQQFPVGTQLLNDFLIVYDETANTFFKVAMVMFQQVNQRSIASSTDLPLTNDDSILNINNVADLGISIPLASTRSGMSFRFKNLPGSSLQTLTPSAPDLLEGLPSLALGPGQSVTLVPYADGINDTLGYAIES